MCRINPRVDFAFKKLFGSEENKDLLISLINAIVSEKDQVIDLDLLNPYNAKDFRNDKLSILDIKAKDKTGNWYNIEMQVADQQFFDKRSLYYWAKLYISQVFAGINYDKLKKTISINILNFNCLDDEHYHNTYKLFNDNSHNLLMDDLEIHFIELEKYDEKLASILDRWVNFLKKAELYSDKYMPTELIQEPCIKKALDVLENLNFNTDEREGYEARLKYLRDEDMIIKTAELKAKKAGIEEGLELGLETGKKQGMEDKAIQIAKNSLQLLTDEQIAQITNLSIEKIIQIRLENE